MSWSAFVLKDKPMCSFSVIIGYIKFQISVLLQSWISWIAFAQLWSTLGSCVVLSGHHNMVCFLERRSAMASSQVGGLGSGGDAMQLVLYFLCLLEGLVSGNL